MLEDKKDGASTTADVQSIDAAHHLHPFTNTGALNRKGARVITRGEGVYLWDSEGNKIIDGMAGLWCVNMGYGRKELTAAATSQMNELAYYNTFLQTTHSPAAELAKEVASVTPGDLNHIFFANSGSEAIDTVIRLVRQYWAIKGKPYRNILISRENAYHGSTLGGTSLGGMSGMHKQGAPLLPGIERIRQPYWYGEAGDMSEEEFGIACAKDVFHKTIGFAFAKEFSVIGHHARGILTAMLQHQQPVINLGEDVIALVGNAKNAAHEQSPFRIGVGGFGPHEKFGETDERRVS